MRRIHRSGSGWILGVPALMALLFAGAAPAAAAEAPASTPAEFVATYSSLADAILAVKKTEASLVRAILQSTYGHAQGAMGRARQAMKSGDSAGARAAVESVAAHVSQLAMEGDASVAGIRKRLVEGGHHHNAKGEREGVFDEGFVVVTRAAKTALLDASKAIGALAASPNEAGLDAEWKKVEAAYTGLMKK